MKVHTWLSAVRSLLLLAANVASNADYFVHRADETGVRVPHTNSAPPSKGQWVTNTTFHTVYRRVSDVTADGVGSSMAAMVYSRWSPVNSSGEYLYLQRPFGGRDALIYSLTTLQLLEILPESITVDGTPEVPMVSMESAEIRWDFTGDHPQRFYYRDGMRFLEYDLPTHSARVIRDFSSTSGFEGAEFIHNDVEGDSSADSRYWAWMVKGPYDGPREPFLAIITYDQETDRIVGRMDLAGYQALGGRYRELPTPNMVEVSPSGRKVIYHLGRCWGAVGTATNWLVFNHPIHVAVLPDVDELISRVEEQDTGVSCREAIGVPDSPGSFFHDRETHQLYLWCSDGAAPSTHRISWEYGERPRDAGGVFDGPHAWDLDFTRPVKVSIDETHSGWAWSYDDRELFVSQNNRSDWIEACDVQSGAIRSILFHGAFGWGNGWHFARMPRHTRGWILMSTYCEGTDTDWGDNQLLMLEVRDQAEQPNVWRLGPTHNHYDEYYAEAFAAISPAGDRLWWNAKWPGQTNIETYEMRLPDGWWRELIVQTRAPTEDTDGDGMPNGDEFAVGTDPADPGSVFRLTAWRADASGSMVLEWPSASNRVYTLWESTNLAGPFQTRATGIVAQPPANRFTNSLEGEATAVFRVSAR